MVPLGHCELASLVGAGRETVSRALNSYRRMGILTTFHRRIVINDSKGLERMATLQSQRRDIDEALAELDESCAMIIRYLDDKGCDTEDLERAPSQA